MAAQYLRNERAGHTLQPTALVHEAYLRFVGGQNVDWQDKNHFFAVAATVMRRILVDHARAAVAGKRGGGARRIPLDEVIAFSEENHDELLALDEALNRLKQLSPRQCRVVELIYFGGMTFEQASAVLGTTDRTAKRDWKAARSWLNGEIHGWTDQSPTVGES